MIGSIRLGNNRVPEFSEVELTLGFWPVCLFLFGVGEHRDPVQSSGFRESSLK